MDVRIIEKNAYQEEALGALLHIPQPPARLWVRGRLPDIRMKKLAVVGSRSLTAYGADMAAYLIHGLAGMPVSVVSGLALGADAAAHRAALATGLHTIAIPGSGLSDSVIAPRTHLSLARDILAAGGALLSEHEPDASARPGYFPSRNRIMAGVADAVLLIEAGERSGTLITARLAGEYGRELLCVPHRAREPHGHGSHLFLRLGATLATEPEHILEALRLERPQGSEKELPILSPDESMLYALLKKPCTRDALIRASRLPAGEALAALMTLELAGHVEESLGLLRRTRAS